MLFALATPPASAQTVPRPGTCALGTATGLLDAGEVSARVFDTGALFYGGACRAAYFDPKLSGRSPAYAVDLWIGGTVGGQFRVAGGDYGMGGFDFTFWPGPLGPGARPVDPTDCAPFDRIYTVARTDVEAYVRTGVATADLRDWPWRLGAPVLDSGGLVDEPGERLRMAASSAASSATRCRRARGCARRSRTRAGGGSRPSSTGRRRRRRASRRWTGRVWRRACTAYGSWSAPASGCSRSSARAEARRRGSPELHRRWRAPRRAGRRLRVFGM